MTNLHEALTRFYRPAVFVILSAAALLFPLIANGAQLFLWETVLLQAVFALSVNLMVGHAGIATFGQAAFFGIGAYAVAATSQAGIAVTLGLLAAIVLAAAASVVVAAIAARAEGLGVMMLTLAVSQGLFSMMNRSNFMGGANGTPVVLVDWFSTTSTAYWYAMLAISAIAALLMWVVLHSPFGLSMRAIRDDPLRVIHFGVSVRLFRAIMFVIAGGFGGLAGGLFACTSQAVDPAVFNWTVSGSALIMALVGGLYSTWGPVLGAIMIVLLNYYLSTLAPALWTFFLGLVVAVMVIALPNGLVSAPERVRALVHHFRQAKWPAACIFRSQTFVFATARCGRSMASALKSTAVNSAPSSDRTVRESPPSSASSPASAGRPAARSQSTAATSPACRRNAEPVPASYVLSRSHASYRRSRSWKTPWSRCWP
jgi:branched-chain amino acid transport system permease protein